MKAKYATSKTRLARVLNIGRNHLHALSQQADFPLATSHGWNIGRVQAWMKRHGVSGGGIVEREALQTELLAAKLEREKFLLSENRGATRAQLMNEFSDAFGAAMQMLRTKFDRMVDELSPAFEGRTARDIHRTWKQRQRQVYAEISTMFSHGIGATAQDGTRIVPFENGETSNGETMFSG